MDKARKPMVWFDVDEVVVDTGPLLEGSLRAVTGQAIPVHTWTSTDVSQIYGLAADAMEAVRERWVADEVLERAPLRPRVGQAMRAIADMGLGLGLITARSWHPQGRSITMEMAHRHRLPIDEVVVLRYDQGKAETLRAMDSHVVGFVDDTHRHVREMIAQGWSAYLMSHPWNRAHTDLPRVESMAEFADEVAKAAAGLGLPPAGSKRKGPR